MTHAALLATRSAGKIKELRPLLANAGFDVIDLAAAGVAESAAEDLLESFETFEDNALAKAQYFHRATGRPTFADDSGLAVDALGGGPGVRSKRWSGRHDLSGQALDDENNRRLLERLHGEQNRNAHYVCAAAYVDDAVSLVALGKVDGQIIDVARGAHGFGYDPFFFSTELARTFGEASREEKEQVSHRGRAFRALVTRIAETRRSS